MSFTIRWSVFMPASIVRCEAAHASFFWGECGGILHREVRSSSWVVVFWGECGGILHREVRSSSWVVVFWGECGGILHREVRSSSRLVVVLRAQMGDQILAHEVSEVVLQLGVLDEQIIFWVHLRCVLGALEVEGEPLLDATLA